MRRINWLLVSSLLVAILLSGVASSQAHAQTVHTSKSGISAPSHAIPTLQVSTLSPAAYAQTFNHSMTPNSCVTRVASNAGDNYLIYRWLDSCNHAEFEQLVGEFGGHTFYVDIANNNGAFHDAQATLGVGDSVYAAEIPIGSSWTTGCGADRTAGIGGVCA